MAQNIIGTFIYIHAGFGGIALLSGSVALLTPKGNNLHRKGGLIFFYTMLTSALMSMIISMLPGHVNYFLFVIGIFSSYMILTGKRILNLKSLYRGEKPGSIDFWLARVMLVTAIAMAAYGIYLLTCQNNNGVVMIVFGAIGFFMALGDLSMLAKQQTDKRFWLYKHITKMTGGYIAALTAFFVVNQVLPGLWGWLSPTVAGSIYITYHQFRFRKKGEGILAKRNIEY